MQSLLQDLHVDLKVYTHFDFQRVLRASFMSPLQYDVWTLHAALEDFGTDEKVWHILLLRSTDYEFQIAEVPRKKLIFTDTH